MLSEPANKVTPCSRSLATGGTGADGGHEVMIATWARASASAVSANTSGPTDPSGNAWLGPARPLPPRRDRPIRDVAQLGRPGLAAVVEMNIDSFAEALGEAEDDVELAF